MPRSSRDSYRLPKSRPNFYVDSRADARLPSAPCAPAAGPSCALRSLLPTLPALLPGLASAGGWQRIFDPLTVRKRSPSTPPTLDVIYLGTSGQGVYKTTDGGAIWNPASTGLTGTFAGYILSIAIDPTGSRTLYAGTNGRGIY